MCWMTSLRRLLRGRAAFCARCPATSVKSSVATVSVARSVVGVAHPLAALVSAWVAVMCAAAPTPV